MFHPTPTSGLINFFMNAKRNWKQNNEFSSEGMEKVLPRVNNAFRGMLEGYFKDECIYPLETNSIKKFVKDGDQGEPSVAYKCMFTFMTTKGFVYGFGVQADIVDGQLLGVQTQQMSTNGEIKPYTDEVASDFTEFEMITKKNIPTLEKLKNEEKSL